MPDRDNQRVLNASKNLSESSVEPSPFESGLEGNLASDNGSAEAELPDPEKMLPLLESTDPQSRMVATRAFCELQDDRAVPALIRLLDDPCPSCA